MSQSESAAWREVERLAEDAKYSLPTYGPDHRTLHSSQRALQRIVEIAQEMQGQLEQGEHVNPPLVIWANPSSRKDDVMSQDVREVSYIHEEDGQPYRHKFAAGVDLVSMDRRGCRYVALIRPDGRPLWEDF